MVIADHILLDRWNRNRDADAFAELVTRYAGLVYGTCRRVLGDERAAEDASQECFVKLAQSAAATIRSVPAWLHTVAVREAVNRLRADSRRLRREKTFAQGHPDSVEIAWDDLQSLVDEAIAGLPDELGVPVVRHFLGGETHETIAQSLEISRSTITRRIERGIELLRDSLRKRGVTAPIATLTALLAANLSESAPASVHAGLAKLAMSGMTTIRGRTKATRPNGHLQVMRYAATICAVVICILVIGARFVRNSAIATLPKDSDTTQTMALETMSTLPNEPLREAKASVGKTTETELPNPAKSESQPVTEGVKSKIATITLKCVDPDGAPVSGAYVHINHSAKLTGGLNLPLRKGEGISEYLGPHTSDSSGEVRFEGLRVYAGHSFFTAVAIVPGRLSGIWTGWEKQVLGATNHNTIQLVNSTTVHGMVSVPAGFDSRNVTVRIDELSFFDPPVRMDKFIFSNRQNRDGTPWKQLYETKPAADGTFVFADIPSGARVYFSAIAPLLGEVGLMDGKPSDKLIEIAMEPEAIIEGRLVQESNHDPVSGVLVVAAPTQTALPITIAYNSTTTDRGEFEFTGLPQGSYAVGVPHDKHSPDVAVAGHRVTVKSGESVSNLRIVVEGGTLVRGIVRDASNGSPIQRVRVGAMSPPDFDGMGVAYAETGHDGRYEMRLPSGEMRLYLAGVPSTYEYPPQKEDPIVNVPPRQKVLDGVDFQLQAKQTPETISGFATAKGKVVGPDGKPVAGADVEKSQEMPEMGKYPLTQPHAATSDKNGEWLLKVRAGAYCEFTVGGGKYTLAKSERVTPEINETVDLGTFVVEEVFGVFSGTVLDSEGNPVGNAKVSVSSSEVSWKSLDVQTGADGRFVIDPAPEDVKISGHIYKQGIGEAQVNNVPSNEDREYVLE
jgi:RNA polymerase sigma factor (sigma-70 family)